jgi:putative transposase
MDNVFTERLWRSLKHEMFISRAMPVVASCTGLAGWIAFYNNRRPSAGAW